MVRSALLTVNLLLLVAVVFFVARTPSHSTVTRQSVSAEPAITDQTAAPLDEVSSADIAVHIARTIGLPERDSVVNHADSVSADEAIAPADTSVVAKPQVVTAAIPTRKDIRSYTTQAGDTLSSLATKFGVSSDSIKWSNNLTGNTIPAGKQLVIPPAGLNGIVYTVASGDTADKLAQKYNTDKDQLIQFNDAEVTGLKPGEQILIPNGVVVSAPVTTSSYSFSNFAWGGNSAVYSANGYDYGWCTWWAAKRRADIGQPLPSNLGNAASWRYLAPRAGLGVDHNPSAGAVAYYLTVGGLGHVGYVEQVESDGSIWISDMNYYGVSQIGGSTPAGGWGRTSYHLVTPDQLGQFLFIH
ncbi:MAG TPA: LysM peptidoglycan-binding domain-containing protein [Patescibacteria group bacterium]|nr:LysM peptidoglycan-binding domain-containing protein [Patescibacteria group bacterium]